MPYTYPPAAPTISGDNVTISRFLKEPNLIARRLRELAEQRFIADVLLSGRYDAVGGSIAYEQGESIYSDRAPEAVAPGAEYPLTPITEGPAQVAKTVKWGRDTEITDEAIARRKMDPVNRALKKMVNQMVKTIDSVALAAIASQVTQTSAASAPWDTGTPTILRDVLRVVAEIRALNEGYEPDIIVVDDLTWANVMSDDKIASLLRREDGMAPVYTGNFPEIGGLRFLPTPNLPVADTALVVDSTQLGGMADEKLAGPGYASAGGSIPGVEVKSIRDEDKDLYRLRSRRVTVPVVLEPRAAWKITGVVTP
ncbi:phage major capsid protein [Nocardia cyriacigeorgica]|uniref:phage major capsid protein n=1 Tax=Nocardia cyriacigeorgica TaxID=135487 RepID=UPI0013D1DBD2|nr:hypothetical protein [Nocardia cyriacigeorgica]NEW27252.1 hypothetical protein [Nocardia cyriacigeorgica]